MTPQRLKELRAHAEAHRHVTTAMALELLEHVQELERGREYLRRLAADGRMEAVREQLSHPTPTAEEMPR